MSKKSDTRSLGTTSGSIKERLSSDKDGGFIRAYLKKGFLTAAMDALFHARRKVGNVPVTYPPGMVFNMGTWLTPEEQLIPIRLLHFEQRRVVIDVAGPS